jgi:uncharacterized membrane protein required for colicin V production
MNLGGLNWVDLIVLFLALASLAIGFAQGMLRQVIGLAALYIAVILATQYYTLFSDFIRAIIRQPTSRFLNAISFFIIVVAVWSLISWLAYDAYSSTRIRLLPVVDQLGGSILSFVTLVATLSVVLPILTFAVGETWPGNESARMVIQQGLQTARLVPVFEALKPVFLSGIAPWLPHGLPSIFNL